MTETSPKIYTRAIGLFLILTMIGGWYGEAYVPSLFMTGDAATTAAQLKNNESLFRLGFAAYLVEAFSDIVLAWLFYVILRPVHRELALLSAFFGLVSMALFAVTQMFYVSAPLFLKGNTYLAAFSTEQLQALSKLFLTIDANLSGLFMALYGTAWILRGVLTFRSYYLPRVLGALMIVAGAGFFAKNVTQVLAPQYSSQLLLLPMFLNVIVLTFWMLARGVNVNKWNCAISHNPER